MEPEKKEPDQGFGKVVEELHNKKKLSALRTYQGDMAEFIREKNESVISVAVKEKERQIKKEKELGIEPTLPKPQTPGLQINLTVIALSLCLFTAGIMAILYTLDFWQKAPVIVATSVEEILPGANKVTLANVGPNSLGDQILKIDGKTGITFIDISDTNGKPISTIKEFFNLLEIESDQTLWRTLKEDFWLGLDKNSPFLIIRIGDHGAAFTGMLNWEEHLTTDLAFLAVPETNTLGTSTPAFVWKDLIIRNKDVRALANPKNESRLAYTFLDKNTILITGDLETLADLSQKYSNHSIVR